MIEQKLKEHLTLRGNNRKENLKVICNLFYSYLKKNGFFHFEKKVLYSFIDDEINKRTKERISKEVLNYLILNKKIENYTLLKSFKVFENKKPSCNDYGSFKVLMEKNGYKKYLYNYHYNENEKRAFKKCVDVVGINQEIEKEFDEIMTKSNIKKDFQKCVTNSHLSLIKRNFVKPIKAFKVL